ncbi:MAG: SLC13 family permease [Gammaproteobacteria bacterium]
MSERLTGSGISRQRIGLVLGPLAFFLVSLLPGIEGLSAAGQQTAAVALLMAIWWITEAIPIPATALLPVFLFPVLGVSSAAQVTANYAHELIFLFLGGFWIAVSLERWNLHRRLALHTIRLVGTGPRRIVLGFMVATAALSMWLSNTATTMMMLPIGIAVLRQVSPPVADDASTEVSDSPFGTALMLGIAYAASIGGVATLIGTPPNAVLAGVLDKLYGYQLTFYKWILFGLPLSIVMLLLAWLYLTRISFTRIPPGSAGGRGAIREELRKLGALSCQEKGVLSVFLLVAACWIGRGLIPLPGLEMVRDSTIAIAGAVALFLIPARDGQGGGLLNWATAVKIPWDIILLFGGGFALADGFARSGLAEWIALRMDIVSGAGWLAVIAVVALLTLFLTEVTSNTATATMLLPIVASIATAADIHPLGPMVAAALAASFAFMLPVATPPNAVVFASRCVTIPKMARAGVWLNLLGFVLITIFVSLILPHLWGLELNGTPQDFR